MRSIRKLFVCLVLAIAALHGTAMRPDHIESLMSALTQPKLAHVLQDEQDSGDGPDL